METLPACVLVTTRQRRGVPFVQWAAMAPEVEHLLDGVRRGDLSAFEGLVRALTGPIYGYVAAIVRDDGAAEEITQDTLIRVYRKRSGLNHGGTLRGYCYRTATNLALDHIRSRRVRRQREQEAASMNPSAHDPREHDLGRDSWRTNCDAPG